MIATATEQLQHILVLDDDAYRHNEFAKRFFGASLVTHTATSARQAINTLKSRDMDFWLVCLDHDLSEEDNKTYRFGKGTGTEVASYIAGNYDVRKHKNLYVVIHSTNSVGSMNMFNILDSAEVPVIVRPFLWTPDVFNSTISFNLKRELV